MSGLKEAEGLLGKLRDACKKGNTDEASKLLSQIKIATMKLGSLPGMKPPSESDPKELLLVREAYELACLHVSLPQDDVPSFDRHMSQLKTLYADYAGVLPASERQFELQGLGLLSLLAQSKIAEFHTELELIPVDRWENPFIRFPIKLEQYLMEGSYQKVLSSVGEVPAPSYRGFVDKLSGTVRDSIAESTEAAYKSLPLAVALKMLRFKTAGELGDYTAMREREWVVDAKAGTVRFKEEDKEDLEVPSQRVIVETLSYAKELERIV
uniref:CSN8/PSMD8/EIF3K domain-containing protein n=1 Tax=Hemiselmis tepida TaxID=464990 RepID=A0A7S0VNT7_9CRYP|mmetsp:Transcript_20662/g.52096  ORF Transcript_20662/g.52096 Transcript_20662/m.52096 type:complete len:268 (+) Transcript_20662:66-869(+)|eukprot:CAMPEP_0174928426 /NCGR_PEP_ID=MMETSP1355-20121228/23403_1 /TAXON_ID=464990 /ORGANISM="Hemiselmis tepida, Strain CCMP443" /LENGTH=267 /DNA_ID=CAMNT_0016174585 /DNA_START=35 /DNA_END=838 /DNA_ORIENTATION=-